MASEKVPQAETTPPEAVLADPSALEPALAAPIEPMPSETMAIEPAPVPEAPAASVAPIALPELGAATPAVGAPNFGLLLDVGIEVAAVVGTRELKLQQLLAVQPGSIIDLEKHAGEPIELYVNGKPIALAEIVVVDGRLGARVVETLSSPPPR